jgi:trehalose/maltose hydrolase-like predicted phosphorylase
MAEREMRAWELIYKTWNPQQQGLREALCALGNGYIVTRGAFEEVSIGKIHYPGTYLAGGYNRLETEIKEHLLENESLVNWPNWLPLNFRPEGGDWFDINRVTLLDFCYRLNVYSGVLERYVRFRDADEREFSLTSRRLVHMENPHLAALEWRLTSHNWSGQIEIYSALDGTVTNQNVERYRALNSKHLEILDSGWEGEDGIFLAVRTNQSHICMTQAARTRVFEGDVLVPTRLERGNEHGHISQHLFLCCQQHKELRIEKIVTVYSSYDFAISEPTLEARKAVRRADCFADLLRSHQRKWRHLWSIADIQLYNSDMETQLILRLHIFHLLQTTSPNTIDRDVGVPSRGWHGEAYRGHILWDELFIFPFLTLRIPELTRSLLMYRYRRLPEARYLARKSGYRGAMFPWQSGSDGREESQVLHLNPHSGRWIPDNSNFQRHVNAAIAYNVWQYYEATNDIEFLSYYGAEMLLEIARFWGSIATYNASRDRYEILGVMGPDEFHTQYPDSDESGLNNNAYTNVMAAWVLRCACSVLQLLDEKRRQQLRELLEIEDEELLRWNEISRNQSV